MTQTNQYHSLQQQFHLIVMKYQPSVEYLHIRFVILHLAFNYRMEEKLGSKKLLRIWQIGKNSPKFFSPTFTSTFLQHTGHCNESALIRLAPG